MMGVCLSFMCYCNGTWLLWKYDLMNWMLEADERWMNNDV